MQQHILFFEFIHVLTFGFQLLVFIVDVPKCLIAGEADRVLGRGRHDEKKTKNETNRGD